VANAHVADQALHVALLEDFPVERWDAIIAINLSSAFHTMRAALPGMK
jgi:3-hydroxybutyrate dehydrogenase